MCQRGFVAVYDEDVKEVQPIKQHPYRISPEKCKLPENEVAYMLEHQPNSTISF